MDRQDLNNIIDEYENVENRGITLSEKLNIDKIIAEYETIEANTKKGYYTLPKYYAFIKRLQYSISGNLRGNDIEDFIDLYAAVEAVRKKLGQEYERRKEISEKVKSIRKAIESN